MSSNSSQTELENQQLDEDIRSIKFDQTDEKKDSDKNGTTPTSTDEQSGENSADRIRNGKTNGNGGTKQQQRPLPYNKLMGQQGETSSAGTLIGGN